MVIFIGKIRNKNIMYDTDTCNFMKWDNKKFMENINEVYPKVKYIVFAYKPGMPKRYSFDELDSILQRCNKKVNVSVFSGIKVDTMTIIGSDKYATEVQYPNKTSVNVLKDVNDLMVVKKDRISHIYYKGKYYVFAENSNFNIVAGLYKGVAYLYQSNLYKDSLVRLSDYIPQESISKSEFRRRMCF